MKQTIHQLTVCERPRERWLSLGPHALSAAELIAIIIRNGTVDCSAIQMAQHLLGQAGQMKELSRWSIDQLTQMKGLGPVKAMQILAAFELGRRLFMETDARTERKIRCPQDVSDWLEPELRFLQKEHFVCIFLNTKHVVIGRETLSIGTLDATLVHPREVYKAAIQRSASSIICVHNHPSGDPTPSSEDVMLTKRLIEAGSLIGIDLLDHVIIGDGRFASLKELGLINTMGNG